MKTLALLLSSGVKAELFRLLFGIGSQELHVRELERQSGFALSTVRQELKNLVTLGLVQARESGNRTYYRGNTHHPLYPEIHSLVLKTSGLADVLRDALGDDGIQVAFVFGSIASGAETPNSDIDLLVIGTVSLRQIVQRLSRDFAKLGREVNPHVLTAAEFARRKDSQDHFVSTVLAAPRLFVIGDEHELERLGEKRLAPPASNQRARSRRATVHRRSRS
jgi:predicted nucleotidyltransferase